MMAQRFTCDLCGTVLPPHGHYIVRIDVFADPSMPSSTSDELEERDFQTELAALLEEMKGLSADDLQDQVHRRFEFKLCRDCQIKFLVNPLGKPRVRRTHDN
jgi:hypothetical protein